MSSGAVAVAVAGAVPQLYFCYQCNRNVSITLLPNDELICPTCNSGFLEEIEDYPNPSPNPTFDHFQSPLLSLFSELSEGFGGVPRGSGNDDGGGVQFARRSFTTAFSVDDLMEPALVGSHRRVGVVPEEPNSFSPLTFLQEYMNTARAGGAQFQIVINGQNSGDPDFQMPANFGDYFIGPGFEQLIQQLAENDPNRYGTPPASRSVVEALPVITVDDNLLKSELAQCAVCKDDFEKGMEVKKMPCNHVYHSDCILPWLDLHNSCPVCRYELPTNDPDYQSAAGNPGAAGGSNASGSSGGGGGGGARRRFNLPLNWPFGRRDGDGGRSSGNNDGNSNSGGQQRRGWM